MQATRDKVDVIDPMKFKQLCWPSVTFYREQREIIYSVRDNDETFVPAGNQLGKDFVTAFICLWFFCSRRPARVVTTSVKADQLNDVLWAEIRRFIDTSEVRLPVQYNHLFMRQTRRDGSLEPRSSLIGQVTRQGESLLGRHLERGTNNLPTTMAVFDEASGIGSQAYESSDTWAHRKLVIGNCYPCTNFFFSGVSEGNKPHPTDPNRLFRNVIKIKASDSPNVKLGLAQKAAGKVPDNKILVPGVIDYHTYVKRRETWDNIRQSIGLDAEFYLDAETLLYPPDWLNLAEEKARVLKGRDRRAKSMGVDVAEGGDSTVWTVIDEDGIIEQHSEKTPNTAVIPNRTLALAQIHNLKPNQIVFDRGGGGKQHADILKAKGWPVRTVGFGEAADSPSKFRSGMKSRASKKAEYEDKYTYKNRRAEMYGILRFEYLDPDVYSRGFAIPERLTELRRQLAPLPLLYDGEGRLYLPPKNRRTKNSNEETITEMLGCSPDEADSLVLAVYGMARKSKGSGISVS